MSNPEEVVEAEPTMQEIFEQHMEQLEEERKDAESVFDLIQEGRAIILTEDDANLVVRALAECEEEERRVQMQTDARLTRIRGKKRSIEYLFLGTLEQWTRAQLEGKKKSIVLPDGTVKIGVKKAGVVVEDEAALREWCRQNLPRALNQERVPILLTAVAEMEEHMEGQLAPGRKRREEEKTFKVSIPKPETKKEFGQ